MDNIRNFVIIAHIDHGKSTLADRILEITKTIPVWQMQPQYLDQLDLERERGITIKMAPVRMIYKPQDQKEAETFNFDFYILNLIDTPGHSDFSYEVSRALKAVEGAVLLVDAVQGVQAQTLANFNAARKAGLKILGCVNKIDLNPLGLESVIKELADLIGCGEEQIYKVSAKTGQGVKDLINGIVKNIPSPALSDDEQSLIFDSAYDDHKGVIAYVRVFGGKFYPKKEARLIAVEKSFLIKETGFFSPLLQPVNEIKAGDIGYIATGIKDSGIIRVGDTIGAKALSGYTLPQPVIFVSLYPDDGNKYDDLKNALNRLKLIDSSLYFEPDFSEILGRGFKVGFLGRLHFEIIIERLKREFAIEIIPTFPSVAYKVKTKKGEIIVETPKDFPEDNLGVYEPIVLIKIITPSEYLGRILSLKNIFHFYDIETEFLRLKGDSKDKVLLSLKMPLAELISDFDDKLKSVSVGYASFSYEFFGYAPAEVAKLEVLVAGEIVAGLTRIVYKSETYHIARKIAEELKKCLPKQLFIQPIQVKVSSRIVARETISALKKDVTGHLYGGDRSRKMKLWKKQKKGKKKLQARGRANIPLDVFKDLLKK
ncbi:MAG: translation elongation factor 4 [Candidatus Liptonbacteria bacterium]|nr:translation elongation factor 4 [Candidatus Liptonbacteria bacterium]